MKLSLVDTFSRLYSLKLHGCNYNFFSEFVSLLLGLLTGYDHGFNHRINIADLYCLWPHIKINYQKHVRAVKQYYKYCNNIVFFNYFDKITSISSSVMFPGLTIIRDDRLSIT